MKSNSAKNRKVVAKHKKKKYIPKSIILSLKIVLGAMFPLSTFFVHPLCRRSLRVAFLFVIREPSNKIFTSNPTAFYVLRDILIIFTALFQIYGSAQHYFRVFYPGPNRRHSDQCLLNRRTVMNISRNFFLLSLWRHQIFRQSNKPSGQ